MRMGLIGLGKMGGNMVHRLRKRQHEVVVFDLDREAVGRAVEAGAESAESVPDLLERLDTPRVVWVMVPHGGPTHRVVDEILAGAAEDDIVVDGGNSHWTGSKELAGRAHERGVHFLDIGMSGGVWGLELGYCIMAGGEEEAFRRIEPILEALAPPSGYARVGPSGAGHFVKMIHNAIEYAMLEAIGEGMEGLRRSEYDLDLEQVAELWGHGSVIRSWLLDLLVRALRDEGGDLARIAPHVDESGTGRWTAEWALQEGIPMPAITLALLERFASQTDSRFSHKVIAALRNQFGGHPLTLTGEAEAKQ